jgi:hypothetical protein
MEHRWGERVILDLPVSVLLGDGHRIDGCLRDASASGGRIDLARCVRPHQGAEVNVRVVLPTAPECVLQLDGCIVRRLRRGFAIAVEWDVLSPNGLSALLSPLALRPVPGAVASPSCR